MVANSDTGQAIQARHYSPHLCVGFLFLILYNPPPPPHPPILLRRPLFTHHLSLNFVTHFTHTTLSHTIFHTQLCHTSSFTHTHTHHLSHTTLSHIIFHTHTPSFAHTHTLLSHTIFHTQLCHAPSFTHNFVTHPSFTHNFVTHTHTIFHTQLCHTHTHAHTHTHHLSHSTLSHTIFDTQLCHTPIFHTQLCHTHTHTIFHTQLCHTPSFTHNFVTHPIFHTQLCHTPSFTHNFVPHHLGMAFGDHLLHLAGWGGTLGRRWSPGAPRHFAWQAWHIVTPTFISPGRRGTWKHLPALGVAGVALRDIHLRLTWHAWRHPFAFGVAGVALVALGWLWWRLCMFDQNGLEAMLACFRHASLWSNVGRGLLRDWSKRSRSDAACFGTLAQRGKRPRARFIERSRSDAGTFTFWKRCWHVTACLTPWPNVGRGLVHVWEKRSRSDAGRFTFWKRCWHVTACLTLWPNVGRGLVHVWAKRSRSDAGTFTFWKQFNVGMFCTFPARYYSHPSWSLRPWLLVLHSVFVKTSLTVGFWWFFFAVRRWPKMLKPTGNTQARRSSFW